MTIWRLFAATIVFAFGSSAALAESEKVTGNDAFDLGAGSDYEGSTTYESAPLPYALGDRRNVFGEMAVHPGLDAMQLRTNIVPSGTINVGPVISYSRERGDVPGKRFDNPTDTDPTWEAGAFVDYRIDNGLKPNTVVGLNFQFSGGVSDSRGGWRFLPNVYYRSPLGDSWDFRAGLYSTYATDNTMSSSTGAGKNTVARSGLDGADGDAGFKDVGIGVGVTYNLTPSWNVDTALRYERLLDDTVDSPATNDQGSANQLFGGVLVRYKF